MIPKLRSKNRVTLRDIYKTYPYRKDKNSPYKISYKEYKGIMDVFCILLVKYLVETGDKYKLPGGLGWLSIQRRKATKIKPHVDYKLTKVYGENIYHTNRHSNGYYARFRWDKGRVRLKNKNLFKFTAVRWAKRYLAKEIKQNNTIVRYGK